MSGDPLICDIPVGPERDAFIVAALGDCTGFERPSQDRHHAMAALDRWCQLHRGWSFWVEYNASWSLAHHVLLNRPGYGHDAGAGITRADAASQALVLAIRAVERGDAS